MLSVMAGRFGLVTWHTVESVVMKRRLPKEDRREQLLSVAIEIIRSEGADALTLGVLAERCGVTKPVAYKHFENREGLLKQLYLNLDQKLVHSMHVALNQSGRSLEELAHIVCSSYIDCMLRVGPEYEAIVAALRGYPGNADIGQKIRDYFSDAYSELFKPFMSEAVLDAKLVFIALHGAIEEMGSSVAAGQVDKESAVNTLSAMVVRVLRPRELAGD